MQVIEYTEGGSIRASIDGVDIVIPDDIENRHRQSVAAWEEAGNAIPPFQPAPPALTDYQTAIQGFVDDAARSKQFNDGVTLASYKDSTNDLWAAQAEAFIAWRDQVWAYSYTQLDAVQNGQDRSRLSPKSSRNSPLSLGQRPKRFFPK